MKHFKIIISTIFISLMATITAFTGQWHKAEYDYWWYQRDNGTYPVNQWEQIDGKWYFFDENGWMMENEWVQNKYYVGDDGVMMINRQTTDGFLVDSNGIYIPKSGDCINGTYRFVKDEPIAIVDGSYVATEPYNGYTIEVKRVNDFFIKIIFTGKYNHDEKLFKINDYGQSRDSTYFCTDDILGISFRDGNLILWPEDGDNTDYYISVYEKIQ